VLQGERGAYRLDRSSDAAELRHLPETVQSVLAARIDRLMPQDKRVLQAASAVGKDVPRALLEAVVEPRRAGPGRKSRAAAGARVPVRARLLPGCRIHVQACADARRRLRRSRPRPSPHPRRTDRGGDRAAPSRMPAGPARPSRAPCAPRRAVGQGPSRTVGKRARAPSPARRIARPWRTSTRRWPRLPICRRAERPSSAPIDVRLDLRYALSPLGEYRRLLEALTDAQHLAEQLDDQRRLATISSFLCNYFSIRFDFPRAVEQGERALAIAAAQEDVGPLRRHQRASGAGLRRLGSVPARRRCRHTRHDAFTGPAARTLRHGHASRGLWPQRGQLGARRARRLRGRREIADAALAIAESINPSAQRDLRLHRPRHGRSAAGRLRIGHRRPRARVQPSGRPSTSPPC